MLITYHILHAIPKRNSLLNVIMSNGGCSWCTGSIGNHNSVKWERILSIRISSLSSLSFCYKEYLPVKNTYFHAALLKFERYWLVLGYRDPHHIVWEIFQRIHTVHSLQKYSSFLGVINYTINKRITQSISLLIETITRLEKY